MIKFNIALNLGHEQNYVLKAISSNRIVDDVDFTKRYC